MNQTRLTPITLFGLLGDARAPARDPTFENALLAAAALSGSIGLLLVFAQDVNEQLFMAVNGAGAGMPDNVRAMMTVLGDGYIAGGFAIAVFARNPRALAFIFVAAIVASLLVQVPKHLIDIARPAGVLDLDSFSVVGNAYKGNSFPSGHSCTAMLAATVLALSFKASWPRALLLGLGAMVAVSRIWVGLHWPSDVFVGAALGTFTGIFIFRLIGGRPADLPWAGKLVVMLLLGAVSANGFLHHTGYEQFPGVATLRLISAGLVAGVVLFWLAVLVWPLAERFRQKSFG